MTKRLSYSTLDPSLIAFRPVTLPPHDVVDHRVVVKLDTFRGSPFQQDTAVLHPVDDT